MKCFKTVPMSLRFSFLMSTEITINKNSLRYFQNHRYEFYNPTPEFELGVLQRSLAYVQGVE